MISPYTIYLASFHNVLMPQKEGLYVNSGSLPKF